MRLYSTYMAVQRQAVHADVPSHPGSPSAAVAAHGAAWTAAPDAPDDVRGGPRCTSGSWLCLCVPPIRVPWSGVLAVVLQR